MKRSSESLQVEYGLYARNAAIDFYEHDTQGHSDERCQSWRGSIERIWPRTYQRISTYPAKMLKVRTVSASRDSSSPRWLSIHHNATYKNSQWRCLMVSYNWACNWNMCNWPRYTGRCGRGGGMRSWPALLTFRSAFLRADRCMCRWSVQFLVGYPLLQLLRMTWWTFRRCHRCHYR